jgi:Mg/Co/Ni transporter MgtE
LLEFSGDSAAGSMTTDYIALRENATVADAIAALQGFEGDMETLTHIFLVDEEERLHGEVALVRLVLAKPERVLSELTDGHIVSCDLNANGKKVAELFDKYNLRSLPVVDKDKKLAGVVYVEQVISELRMRQ